MAHLFPARLRDDPGGRSPAPSPTVRGALRDARSREAGEEADADDGPLDGRYVRMLEHWLRRYRPSHWPVTLVRDTLEEIRAAGQYGGENPRIVPADAYAAERLEEAPLLNTATGEVEPAAIYRMEAAGDG